MATFTLQHTQVAGNSSLDTRSTQNFHDSTTSSTLPNTDNQTVEAAEEEEEITWTTTLIDMAMFITCPIMLLPYTVWLVWATMRSEGEDEIVVGDPNFGARRGLGRRNSRVTRAIDEAAEWWIERLYTFIARDQMEKVTRTTGEILCDSGHYSYGQAQVLGPCPGSPQNSPSPIVNTGYRQAIKKDIELKAASLCG